MCPACEGIGTARTLDEKEFVDLEKSLNEGPFRHGPFGKDGWYIKVYTQSGRFDNDKKLKDYTKDEWDDLLYGSGYKVRVGSGATARNAPYEGVIDKFTRLYIRRDTSDLSEANRFGARGGSKWRRDCIPRDPADTCSRGKDPNWQVSGDEGFRQ